MSEVRIEDRHFEIHTERLSLEQVQERVSQWKGDGWVCFASGIRARRGTRLQEIGGKPGQSPGIPLSGEWLDGETSVHLRQDGEGWILTRVTERAGTDRVVPCDFCSTEPEFGNMKYRTLWKKVPRTSGGISIQVWTPICSRFAGWK